MSTSRTETIGGALELIFQGIRQLQDACPGKKFTIDGRLVGDIGEMIAEIEYDFRAFSTQQRGHDGESSSGRRVQVKATFKDSLTFRTVPDYYLGFKLYPDGHYAEVYNGPGSVILARYRLRKGIGKELLSFPIGELAKLSADVREGDRIPRKQR